MGFFLCGVWSLMLDGLLLLTQQRICFLITCMWTMASAELDYAQGVPKENVYLRDYTEPVPYTANGPRFRAILERLANDPDRLAEAMAAYVEHFSNLLPLGWSDKAARWASA